jgi:hypothetical protein
MNTSHSRFHAQQCQPTRLLRKCHLRKLYRRRRAIGWTPPIQSRRMEEWRINGLGSIFPGFDTWYRANYDELGYRLPHTQIPGLRGGEW